MNRRAAPCVRTGPDSARTDWYDSRGAAPAAQQPGGPARVLGLIGLGPATCVLNRDYHEIQPFAGKSTPQCEIERVDGGDWRPALPCLVGPRPGSTRSPYAFAALLPGRSVIGRKVCPTCSRESACRENGHANGTVKGKPDFASISCLRKQRKYRSS